MKPLLSNRHSETDTERVNSNRNNSNHTNLEVRRELCVRILYISKNLHPILSKLT